MEYALTSFQQVTLPACTRCSRKTRLEALVSACGGSSPVELCLEGAEDCLVAAGQLVADGKDTLAAPLCDVLGVRLTHGLSSY